MTRGEPAEVVIQQDDEDKPPLYVGGIVAFCRHIEGGVYEVGIQLLAQGKSPILPRQPAPTGGDLHWAVKAFRDAHNRGDDLKESA